MLRKPLALAAVLALALLVALGVASRASADPALAGTFDVSGSPGHITAGSDGNMWFTINGSSDNKEIGKITPDGTVTEYDTPGDKSLVGLTTGPDGNLWGTTTNGVVKMPTSDPSTGTAFAENNIAGGTEIVTGPDGHLWTGGNPGLVVEIPPNNPGQAGGDLAHPGIVTHNGLGIAVGGDGNLWIADENGDATDSIVRFSTAGTVVGTPTPTGNGLQQSQIVAGPQGQMAFTQPIGGGVAERIGRIDYSGHIDFTDMPNGLGDPVGIVFGNDGAYWIANFGADKVRRVTPSGDLTEPISFDAGSGPRQIATGPNDTLWVSLETSKKIAKITGVSAPPGGGGGGNPPPDTTKPVVSSLHLSDRTFRLGSQLATFSKKKRKTPIGTTITFKVSEDSTVRFTFAKPSKGFKSGKKCVARKPKGKKRAKRCTRFKNVKPSLSFAATAGSHRLEFEGRLNRRHKLKPGRYRLSVVATDKAGNKSKARTVNLKVLKK